MSFTLRTKDPDDRRNRHLEEEVAMGMENLEDEGVNQKEVESKSLQSEISSLKKTRKISYQELLLWTA